MTEKIEKRSSPEVKKVRDIRDGSDPSQVFCEGLRLCEDLLKSGWIPSRVYCTEKVQKTTLALLKSHKKEAVPLAIVSDSVMGFISDVSTPPGVIMLAKKKYPAGASKSSVVPLILVLHGLQLPQNVGALLRSAEAAGVTDVFVTKNSADPFGPKALRGSSGSAFRLAIRSGLSWKEAMDECRSRGAHVVAATQNGQELYDRYNWTQATALVMGAEAAGFNENELKEAQSLLLIPMKGSLESLNVGVAGSVCLFEAARQRRQGGSHGA